MGSSADSPLYDCDDGMNLFVYQPKNYISEIEERNLERAFLAAAEMRDPKDRRPWAIRKGFVGTTFDEHGLSRTRHTALALRREHGSIRIYKCVWWERPVEAQKTCKERILTLAGASVPPQMTAPLPISGRAIKVPQNCEIISASERTGDVHIRCDDFSEFSWSFIEPETKPEDAVEIAVAVAKHRGSGRLGTRERQVSCTTLGQPTLCRLVEVINSDRQWEPVALIGVARVGGKAYSAECDYPTADSPVCNGVIEQKTGWTDRLRDAVRPSK